MVPEIKQLILGLLMRRLNYLSLLSRLNKMKLHQLIKTTTRKKKRLGRGYGSGKGGHTVGRGAKGDKARGKVPLTFAGTKIKKSWLKRLPFWRGRGRKKSIKPDPVAINLNLIDRHFQKGERVDLKALVAKGIISQKEVRQGAKILGRGKIDKPLKIALPCSKKAAKKIIAAGGKVIYEQLERKN